MIIKIPQNNQWSQLNAGDIFGTLSATRNIDLNTPGVLKLAQRTRYVGQTSSGNFLDAHNILLYNQIYYVCSTRMFSMTRSLGSFAEDVSANAPSSGPITDGCIWNNAMYVAKTSRISKLSGSTWTQDWSSADFANTGSSFPHPIEPNVKNTDILVGDGNLLKKCDSSGTITTAVTFPSNYVINWIRRGTNVNYIGLNEAYGGRGAVGIWDGLSTTLEANSIIPINATTALSGVTDDDGIFHILLSDGRLMKFNGSGFSYEAELPPFRDYLLRKDWGGSLTVQNRVLNRGMCMIRGKIHVAVTAQPNGLRASNFSDGIWVYDRDNKAFYHKYSPSNANTVTDFGQCETTVVSGLCPVFEGGGENDSNYVDPTASTGGFILFASRVSGATQVTSYRNLLSATTGENRGQFTLNKIESPNILDSNIGIWCKYEGLNTSTDKIVFKYRTKYRDAISILSTGITWSSDTVFTSTSSNMSTVEVGDEVTILSGNGAGSTAHISTISYSAPTYTVTLDEAITGVSATNNGNILIENFKKISTTITYTDTSGYKNIPIPERANKTWLQIKGELRGEGGVVGIRELQVVKNDFLKAS